METYTLAQPAPTPAAPTPPAAEDKPAKKGFPKALLVGGIVLGFIIFFMLGLLVAGGGKKNASDVTAAPTEIPTPTPRPAASSGTPEPVNSSILYLPGKPYYDDSIAVLSKTEPRQVLLVSLSRFGQTDGFTQYAKVNYFTGTTWLRDAVTSSIPSAKIVNNPLIRRFTVAPGTSLNGQNPAGLDIMIENNGVTLTLKKLSPDVSALAYQGYTKFNYYGEGTLKTADDTLDVYILYSQTFAMNAADLSFLSTPEKLTSNWLVFWDEHGTAYYLESLSSTDQSDPYENYQSGAIIYPDGKSLKVSQAQIQPFGQNDQYTARFQSPTQSTQINFAISNTLNKAAVKTYTWQTGTISGTVSTGQTTLNGAGIIETIHKK